MSEAKELSSEVVLETAATRLNAVPQPQDPNLVEHGGSGDSTDPRNWSPARKWGIVVLLSGISLVT